MAEVYEWGWCTWIGKWNPELGMLAGLLLVEGHAPMVLACVGACAQLTRPRVQREFGPRLLRWRGRASRH